MNEIINNYCIYDLWCQNLVTSLDKPYNELTCVLLKRRDALCDGLQASDSESVMFSDESIMLSTSAKETPRFPCWSAVWRVEEEFCELEIVLEWFRSRLEEDPESFPLYGAEDRLKKHQYNIK